MRKISLTLLCLLTLPLMAPAQIETIDQIAPAEEEAFPIIGWPAGDADSGQAAFEALKCTACHRVPSITALAGAGGVGPDLVAEEYARPRLALLRQIVVPGSNRPGQVSHMGNFAEVMTVQQLTDIIAFIERIDERGR